MAGANMNGGKAAGTQRVPAIGGVEGRSGLVPEAQTAEVAASAHLSDANRAEGVNYPETAQVAVTTKAYPAGTAMSDSTRGDHVN